MLVKAKWNVKDAAGWHNAGEVFKTDADLGDAVEVLDGPKKTVKASEPIKAAEPETVKEPEKEAPKAEKPNAAPVRRRNSK